MIIKHFVQLMKSLTFEEELITPKFKPLTVAAELFFKMCIALNIN